MFNNKGFCEKCKKLQLINITIFNEKKSYTIGEIKFEKYVAHCSICNSKIYSYELNKKSEENRERELKNLQNSIKIKKILNGELKKDITIINFNEEDIETIKKILKDKNKRN